MVVFVTVKRSFHKSRESYTYLHICVFRNLELHWFQKVAIKGPLLGSMALSTTGAWLGLQYRYEFSSGEWGSS